MSVCLSLFYANIGQTMQSPRKKCVTSQIRLFCTAFASFLAQSRPPYRFPPKTGVVSETPGRESFSAGCNVAQQCAHGSGLLLLCRWMQWLQWFTCAGISPWWRMNEASEGYWFIELTREEILGCSELKSFVKMNYSQLTNPWNDWSWLFFSALVGWVSQALAHVKIWLTLLDSDVHDYPGVAGSIHFDTFLIVCWDRDSSTRLT